MIHTPKPKTLAKYGLSAEDFRALLQAQGGVCYVCKKAPESGRLHIDHEHVRGWAKLPDERRRLYVRGLLCHWCNRSYVGRCITIEKAARVVEYLQRYAVRRPV